MHELVEQTTQVLQQAGRLKLSRLRLRIFTLNQGLNPRKASMSPSGRLKAESLASLGSIARHCKAKGHQQAPEAMQDSSQPAI